MLRRCLLYDYQAWHCGIGLTEKEITAGGKQRYPSETQGMIAYLVREVSGMSLTDLSRRLKRDVSSLSAVAERVLNRSREDSHLEKRKQLLERALFKIP